MLTTSVLSILWLLCGLVAVLAMLQQLGGRETPPKKTEEEEPGQTQPASPFDALSDLWNDPKVLRRVHRISGGIFSLGYVLFLLNMVPKYQNNSPLLPSPFTIHAYLGAALFPLLLVKHLVIRVFKKHYTALPYLGVLILTVAVGTVSLTGGHYVLLWLRGPSTKVVSEGEKRKVSVAMGRDLLHSKCARCHPLRPTYLYRNTEDGWRLTVQRMADKRPGLCSRKQVNYIVGFLKAELGPVDRTGVVPLRTWVD